MIEGFDADDRYRMVEDEFLAMAGSFTRHLHAAEYQRLKDAANNQNADMIRTISRPVTGRMTDLVKKRQSALALAASQRKGLKGVLGKRKGRVAQDDGTDDDDEDGELPWAGTSLQGLMESPKKKAVVLPAGSTAAASESRGSSTLGMGLGRSRDVRPSTFATATDEDDEDDLDSQPRLSARLKSSKPRVGSILATKSKAASIEAMSRRQMPGQLFDRPKSPPVVKSERSERNTTITYRSEQHLITPSGTSGRSSTTTAVSPPAEESEEEEDIFAARIRKRREEQELRRQRLKRKSDDDQETRKQDPADAIPASIY